MTKAGTLRIGVFGAAALIVGALAATARPAAAAGGYTCTGNSSVDQANLQPLISAGGVITLQGPRACAGNYQAAGTTATIAGAGGGAIIDGGGTGSVLIASDATVTLSNLVLIDGTGSGGAGEDGGGISVHDSTLTLLHCRVTGNSAGDQGGGIYATEATVTLTDSTVSNNTSGYDGGGIDADEDVVLTVAGSTVSDNSTGAHGGGIESFDGTLSVTDSTISNNRLNDSTGFRSGGGIWAGLADVSLTDSTVSHNHSTEFGGGIGYSGGSGTSLSLTNTTVVGNQAATGGGGIRNDAFYGNAALQISHSTLIGNVAGNGGGIDDFALGGNTASVSLSSSTVAGNRASHGTGGAVNSFIDPSGGSTIVSVAQTTIGPRPHHLNDGNQADFGAGLAANGANGTATILLRPGAVVTGNVAAFDGGGIFTAGGAGTTVSPGALVLLNRPDNVS